MNQARIIELVKALLYQIEGPELRKDLEKTPDRVFRTLGEVLDGYDYDIESLFKISEDEGHDQIVAVRDISTYSICQHHLTPFHCLVHVAYLPVDRVIGVSKIERLVHAYSHRLQLQERITRQIADAMMTYLKPHGVAVIIQGEHLCMRMRGVKGSSTVMTSVMLGTFRDNQSTRLEVLSLLGLR